MGNEKIDCICDCEMRDGHPRGSVFLPHGSNPCKQKVPSSFIFFSLDHLLLFNLLQSEWVSSVKFQSSTCDFEVFSFRIFLLAFRRKMKILFFLLFSFFNWTDIVLVAASFPTWAGGCSRDNDDWLIDWKDVCVCLNDALGNVDRVGIKRKKRTFEFFLPSSFLFFVARIWGVG